MAESVPGSVVDLLTWGRGPKTPQRSTCPSPEARSILELELVLISEPVRDAVEPWLVNQPLPNTHSKLQPTKWLMQNKGCEAADSFRHLRFCLGEDWGVPEGVDWLDEGCFSSLASTLCIWSFYTSNTHNLCFFKKDLYWRCQTKIYPITFGADVKRISAYMHWLCQTMVSGLLCIQAFVWSVACIGQSCLLLKLVHALLGLLCNVTQQVQLGLN